MANMEPLLKAIHSCTNAKISVDALKKILKAAKEYTLRDPTILDLDLMRPVIVGNGKSFLLLNHLKAGDKVINPFGREKIIFFGIDLDTYEIKAIAIAKKELCEPETWDMIHQEIKIMEKCKGTEAIIQMDLAFSRGESIFIVMEYCNAGQLGDLLIALVTVHLDQRLIIKLALDIATGLKNLHALGILHRDIKPQNIFMIDKPEITPRAVIADLGAATEMNDQKQLSKFIGSYPWFSPERARAARPDKTEEELLPEWLEASIDKIDIWALGCVFFLLFKGGVLSWQRIPEGKSRSRVVNANLLNIREEDVIEDIKNSSLDPKFKPLLTGMLQVDPKKRWDANEVYEYLLKMYEKAF